MFSRQIFGDLKEGQHFSRGGRERRATRFRFEPKERTAPAMVPALKGLMTQPVSFGSRSLPIDTPDEEEPSCTRAPLQTVCDTHAVDNVMGHPAAGGASSAALRFCREADTVIEGFLCSEPLVVSSACRKPSQAFDAYVCDEPRMRALQTSIVTQTLAVLKGLLLQWMGRIGK
jgi:hypothetical protein